MCTSDAPTDGSTDDGQGKHGICFSWEKATSARKVCDLYHQTLRECHQNASLSETLADEPEEEGNTETSNSCSESIDDSDYFSEANTEMFQTPTTTNVSTSSDAPTNGSTDGGHKKSAICFSPPKETSARDVCDLYRQTLRECDKNVVLFSSINAPSLLEAFAYESEEEDNDEMSISCSESISDSAYFSDEDSIVLTRRRLIF